MERKLIAKLYKYGSFKNFIRATGPETSRRLKYWAPIYFQVKGEVWEKTCVCTHKLKRHAWVLGKQKWTIDIEQCNVTKCRCGIGTQDNLKFIENLKP